MTFDSIPISALFFGTIAIVIGSIELGFRLGRVSRRKSEDEKESPVSAIAGSILGLLAFMLAFTFGIVAERFDNRKGLVREEANLIRTAYQRSDFLPEADRATAKGLMREYLEKRITFTQEHRLRGMSPDQMKAGLAEATGIQQRLWDMAVENARLDMDSDVAALYIESLNDMTSIHGSRVAVGLQQRVPSGIWIILWSLIFFGMTAVGYQTGIAGSKRTPAQGILAISFSMVITLIAMLDRPHSRYITVPQQPLIDLQDQISGTGNGPTAR